MRAIHRRAYSVLVACLALASALSFVTSDSPSEHRARSPGGDSPLAGELANLSLSASFLASLQAPDGGIEEGEDNNYENTDNTLEAVWLWCLYYRATGDNQYFPNVLMAWNYSYDHPAWTEGDSGRIYSSGWALLAETEYRKAYGLHDAMFYANQSASYIISRNGWEEPIVPFTVTAKRHIMGWGAGALHKWATHLGNASAAQSAVTIGDVLKQAVEADTTLLHNESWALAGGASFWGIAMTVLAENPNASWVHAYAPLMKTEVTDPGVGPGNSQNGWEAWYALGWWAAYNATGNQTYRDNYQNITDRLIQRDGDRDGGMPTNVGDPDDGDESWVTAYRAYFCLRQGIPIYDLRPPGPPEITSIVVTDGQNVTLTWNLSSDDGTGTGDVIGYDILTSEIFSSSGVGYQLLAALPNATSSFVHLGAGSDANTHFYYVTAKDVEGRTSQSAQAVKFSQLLPVGPKLICLPLLEGDVPIDIALTGVEYDFVRAHDGDWQMHSSNRDYGGLVSMNASTAVWINVTSSSEIVMTDLVPLDTTIHLRSGWNLIGFPSFASNYTVAMLRSEISVLRVEGYSSINLPHHLRVLQDIDVLQTGQGYWILTDTNGTVTVNL